MEVKVFIYDTYYLYELVFEGLYGSLCIVGLVITWGKTCYLMSTVVIAILKYVAATLYMEFNPEFIPRLFKSSVNSVKVHIFPLSLILFIGLVRLALKAYTYMT